MASQRWGAASDAGVIRTVNQDAYLAADDLFAVADGMGGHAGGEIASRLAIDALRTLTTPLNAPEAIADAFAKANTAILERTHADPDLDGMGSTMSLIGRMRIGGVAHVVVANVGDSRVYQLDGANLRQITVDHSEVQELITQGKLTPTDAQSYRRRNVITRSLGTDPCPNVDMWVFPLSGGGRFIVCSDGLYNEIPDEELTAFATLYSDPQALADRLLRTAIDAGARDNVTVIVADLPGDLPADQAAAVNENTQPRVDRS